MLDESLSYPHRSGSWRTVLTGGLLTVFGFLIVPAFIVSGYLLRVLRSAALDEEVAPQFEDWGGLLVDGLKAVGIGLVYFIVPYVVVVVTVFGSIFAASGNDGSGTAVVVLLALVGLVGFVLMFVAAYVLPVALTNFALEERVGAAFAFRKIATAAFSREYAVAVLLSMAVGLVVVFVFFIVNFIITFIFQFILFATILGGGGDPNMFMSTSLIIGIVSLVVFVVLFAVVAFVGFYVQVVTYYLLGRGGGKALLKGASSVD